MKRLTFIGLCVVILGVSVFSPPTFAIFGIDIGFDTGSVAEATKQMVEQLERQYQQLVETYELALTEYDHLLSMSKHLPGDLLRRYRSAATSWGQSEATDAFGTTGKWIAGINTGLDVAEGYAAVTERLAPYGVIFDNVPADQRERLMTSYATVELTDGANLHAIDTIGRLRANAVDVENVIQDLEDDSLSDDPNLNTEIAVLNKINAANVIAIRSAQDTNKLLVTLAEGQVIEAKRQRDAEAKAINNHIRFMSEGKAALAEPGAGASDAMRAWRMP